MTSDSINNSDHITTKEALNSYKVSWKKCYGFGFALSVLSFFFYWWLHRFIGHSFYILAYPVVFIVSTQFGFKPALLTSIFCWTGLVYFSLSLDNISIVSEPLLWQNSLLFLISTLITSRMSSKKIKALQKNAIKSAHLHLHEENIHLALKSVPAMLWISNTNKILTWFSIEWLTFTGRTTFQESKNGWISSIHPDDIGNYLSIFIESFDSRKEFLIQYRLRHNSGAYRWVMNKGIPRYDEKKTFLGFVGSCMDIHEQKLKEEKLSLALIARDELLSIAVHELKTL